MSSCHTSALYQQWFCQWTDECGESKFLTISVLHLLKGPGVTQMDAVLWYDLRLRSKPVKIDFWYWLLTFSEICDLVLFVFAILFSCTTYSCSFSCAGETAWSFPIRKNWPSLNCSLTFCFEHGHKSCTVAIGVTLPCDRWHRCNANTVFRKVAFMLADKWSVNCSTCLCLCCRLHK